MTSTCLGTRHQSLPRLHALGLVIARPFLEALAHLVSTPFHAGGVGSIVVAAPRLGLSLGLLLGLGRLLIPAGLPSYAHRSPHRGPYGRSLPGIAANGPPNSPNGRATARAAYRPAPLGGRRVGTLLGLGRVCPRLPFRPLMTSELILLELLLALPLLRVGKDLG